MSLPKFDKTLVDLEATENTIINLIKELQTDFRFKAIIHPGSLDSLGETIQFASVILRYIEEIAEEPENLNAPCINQKVNLMFQVNVVYVDYRTHQNIYRLARAVQHQVRGHKDLLTFETETTQTRSLHSYANNFRFLETATEADHACYSYTFDLKIPYFESYFNKS